ncbi:hypothetical protein [Paramicrobacterium agarici]|uniref:hypothetical protein n=1 Tax=Paramicrobacterium agarici TaxID=630514 RepID=UPI00114E42A1|nr:hypothetical protein [Microbacterium agarici]TQO24242.1 hypothetical protein FB385_3122 [Microbacterium agarici]
MKEKRAPEGTANSGESARLQIPKSSFKKGLISIGVAVAVLGAGLGALNLPPVQNWLAAGVSDAIGVDSEQPKAQKPKQDAEPAEEAVEVPSDITNGEAITAEQAKSAQEAYRAGDNSRKPYQMADGTWVLLMTSEKLPQAVKEDFVAQTPDYTVPSNADSLDESIGSQVRVRDAGSTATYATGRLVIVVGQVFVARDPGSARSTWWAASGYGKFEDQYPQATADAVIANMTATLNEAGITDFEVIVLD